MLAAEINKGIQCALCQGLVVWHAVAPQPCYPRWFIYLYCPAPHTQMEGPKGSAGGEMVL